MVITKEVDKNPLKAKPRRGCVVCVGTCDNHHVFCSGSLRLFFAFFLIIFFVLVLGALIDHSMRQRHESLNIHVMYGTRLRPHFVVVVVVVVVFFGLLPSQMVLLTQKHVLLLGATFLD